MFCKFVIKIRHLSIKIIYASRTGQMIVLYNPINSNNPDQKPDCIPCFLSMYTRYPCKLSITSNLHFWTMCNLSPWRFIPQPGGVLHFDLIRPLPIPGYAFHSHLPPKIQHPESKSFITFLTTPKLYKILTQFNKPLRHRLRHTPKISLNHNIK